MFPVFWSDFLSGFRIFPDFLPGFQKFSITLTVIYFYIIFLSLIFSEFFRIFFGFFNSLIVSYFELYFWNNRISFKFFSFSAFFCLFKFWFFVLFIIICSKVFELLCHEFFTEASLFPDYQWAFDTKIIVMNVWQYWRSVVSTKNGSNTNITHINLVWMYDLWFQGETILGNTISRFLISKWRTGPLKQFASRDSAQEGRQMTKYRCF